MSDMSSPEVNRAKEAIDEAVRAWSLLMDPDVTITGWVLAGAGIRVSEAADPNAGTAYVHCRSAAVQFHSAIGLHYNAIYDLTHPEDES